MKKFESWIFDESVNKFVAPINPPKTDKIIWMDYWDENTQWIKSWTYDDEKQKWVLLSISDFCSQFNIDESITKMPGYDTKSDSIFVWDENNMNWIELNIT